MTVDMEVLEQTGAGWEGRFCFNLPTRILGYEMIVHFNSSVKQITVRVTETFGSSVSECE